MLSSPPDAFALAEAIDSRPCRPAICDSMPFRRLAFSSLSMINPPLPQYRFRNIDKRLAAPLEPANPRASARVSIPFYITSLNRHFDGEYLYPFVCSLAAMLSVQLWQPLFV